LKTKKKKKKKKKEEKERKEKEAEDDEGDDKFKGFMPLPRRSFFLTRPNAK